MALPLGLSSLNLPPSYARLPLPIAATYLLYIVSGSADIIVKWSLPPKKRASQTDLQPGQQPPPAGSPQQAGGGGDEFMDETSETMSPIVDQESRDNRMKLLRASTKALDFVKKLQEAAGEGWGALFGCYLGGSVCAMCTQTILLRLRSTDLRR